MLNLFNISTRALLVLVIFTLVLGTALVSQLDNNTQFRIHIPHIPVRGPHPPASQAGPTPAKPGRLDDVLVRPTLVPHESVEHHWIDDLIEAGNKEYDGFLSKQTQGVSAAAAAYRRRRGRQPPPLFDQWVRFAEENNAVMVEDFFDQIYTDLDPFWAVEPERIRHAARAWKCFISVRDGNVTQHTEEPRAWMDLWSDMISQISHLLPDMDIAINEMDESRVMAPWDTVNELMQAAGTKWSKFPPAPEMQNTEYPARYNSSWAPELYPDFGFQHGGSLWNIAKDSCPPDSPGRHAQRGEVDYTQAATFPLGAPEGSYHGYVANWTHSKDPCAFPHLRELHGSFIEPLTMATTARLIPMFGGSKLPMNNDILIPAAMYWTNDTFYKGGERHTLWEEKDSGIIWRGAASGGRNKKGNWHRFQRHRFVSMLNGTQVHAAELLEAATKHPELDIDVSDLENKTAHNFPLPPQDVYNLSSYADGRLGPWIDSYSDGKFATLLCFPNEKRGRLCSYTDPYYMTSNHTPMEEQYKQKYLPDIDGNSFSGRYRGFLRSYSLPIKATIYNEWHDSRLVPWKHFVPMDNTFVDFYGIMEYFLGYEPARAVETPFEHDADADVDYDLRKAHALDLSTPGAKRQVDATLESSPLASENDGKISSPPANDLGPSSSSSSAKNPPYRTPPQLQSNPPKAPAKPSRDHVARRIAESGHDWAERVLRREDMLIYTHRLLLEYARISAESRERMGWVGDGIIFGYNDEQDRQGAP